MSNQRHLTVVQITRRLSRRLDGWLAGLPDDLRDEFATKKAAGEFALEQLVSLTPGRLRRRLRQERKGNGRKTN